MLKLTHCVCWEHKGNGGYDVAWQKISCFILQRWLLFTLNPLSPSLANLFFFFISLQYRFLWILSLFLSAGRKFIVKNNNKTKHEWSQSLGYQLSGSGVIYTYECVLPQWLEMLDHGEDGSVPVRTPPLASIYNDDTCRWHRVISATSASLSFSSKTYFIIHWLTKT